MLRLTLPCKSTYLAAGNDSVFGYGRGPEVPIPYLAIRPAPSAGARRPVKNACEA